MINNAGEGCVDPVETAVGQVKEEVSGILLSSPVLVRNYISHLLGASGKFIRAVCLATCALDPDGRVHPNAVKAAAAIEILHLATLVHDDVIDDADIRRGIPTLQKKFGKRVAVICGDYLFSLALKLGANVENKRDYLDLHIPDYVSRICVGELTQNINTGNFDLSERQYLKIISGKTAALFEASFYAGGVFSGSDKKEWERYKRLGRHIGMIFQLMDDCMDYASTAKAEKKPVHSDFEQKVVTLPLIYTLGQSPELKDRAKAGEKISRNEINRAVAEAGGLAYTKQVAQRYYEKALDVMETMDLSAPKKAGLTAILKKVYRE